MPHAYDLTIVYAIRCGEAVKVGITTKLSDRLASIRILNPMPLTVERQIWLPWARAVWLERQAHQKLRAHAIHGEWFSADAAMIREIFNALLPLSMQQAMPARHKADAEASERARLNTYAKHFRANMRRHTVSDRRIMAALEF